MNYKEFISNEVEKYKKNIEKPKERVKELITEVDLDIDPVVIVEIEKSPEVLDEYSPTLLVFHEKLDSFIDFIEDSMEESKDKKEKLKLKELKEQSTLIFNYFTIGIDSIAHKLGAEAKEVFG